MKPVGSYRSEVKARQDVKPDICQPPYTDYRQPPVDYRHPPVADYRQPPTMDYRHPPPLIDYRQHSIPDYRPQVGLQTPSMCRMELIQCVDITVTYEIKAYSNLYVAAENTVSLIACTVHFKESFWLILRGDNNSVADHMYLEFVCVCI